MRLAIYLYTTPWIRSIPSEVEAVGCGRSSRDVALIEKKYTLKHTSIITSETARRVEFYKALCNSKI